MLFTAEAWSGVTEKQLARMEVVDTSLLRKLTGGHSKCPTEFYHLETSTWKLRHHLMYRRIMYHHHLVTRDKTETIYKIYQKQKNDSLKGDWIELLKADFKFIKQELNEEEISSISKIEYKKKIKQLMNNSVFEYFLELKNGHTKIVDITYNKFQIQPYLTTKELNNSGKELLFNLRSNCHSSKQNFRKMNKNNTNCIFQCPQIEDQRHSFTQCTQILNTISNAYTTKYEDIYGTINEQIKSTIIFLKIEKKRNHHKKYHLLPGGRVCQDPCTFGFTPNGAADTMYICT